MCRMMGVVSRGPVYYDLFEEFADLATKGMCPIGAPDERGHKDGWGLACFQNGSLKVHMRDAGSAPDASKYYGTAWKIAKLNMERAPGQSLIVMGHLRRASSQGLVAEVRPPVHRGAGRGHMGVPAQRVTHHGFRRFWENRFANPIRDDPELTPGKVPRRRGPGHDGSARIGHQGARRVHESELHALGRRSVAYVQRFPNKRPVLYTLLGQFRGDGHRSVRAHPSDASGAYAARNTSHNFSGSHNPSHGRWMNRFVVCPGSVAVFPNSISFP